MFDQFTPTLVLHILETDEWIALNVIFSFFLLLSVVYAYKSLKEMARNQRLGAAQLLYQELKSTEKDRSDIISKIFTTIDPEKGYNEIENYDVTKLNNDDITKIRNIINSFNRLGLLIENDTISQHMVFSICYPAIIQSWAVCESYANNYQNLIGVPYARRVERLAKMAKNYLDSNSKANNSALYLTHSNNRILIYKKNDPCGFDKVLLNLKWSIMKISHNYSSPKILKLLQKK